MKNNTYILCACGCGKKLLRYDKYDRERKYISGHNRRKYKDKLEYKKVYNNKKSTKNRKRIYKFKARHERKIQLIKYKGNKCKICKIKFDGFNESIYDFHHKNPKEKKFSISGNVMEKSLKKLKIEADKCDLLCSNCHRLLHFSKKRNNVIIKIKRWLILKRTIMLRYMHL